MYAQARKNKKNKSGTIANNAVQKKSIVNQGFEFIDNRPEAIAQRKLVNVQGKAPVLSKGKDSNIIQKYSYSADGAEITVQLPNSDTRTWIESTEAEVTWNKGETMDPNGIGSHKVNNHGWKGILKNQSNGNNATGLHMVNANWGGSANALEGNLVPGTPSLNGHHKSIENAVHNLFSDNGGIAPDDISYKADVWTPYSQKINLKNATSGDEIDYHDPTIKCTVIVGSTKEVDNEKVELGGGTKIVVP
ncbi:MAG: hypothetical protein ACJA1C_001737 [Crocinitomicaceae bacterium]|jgi:hypothetical protein